MICHSEKESATRTWKKTFGFHPLLCFLDNTGEALTGLLRESRAGSNTHRRPRNPTEGRVYFDRKKAAGKTSMAAVRALKRRLPDIVYRQMVNDATAAKATGSGGQQGTSTNSSVTSLHPHTGSSEKSLPEPADDKLRTPMQRLAQRGASSARLNSPDVNHRASPPGKSPAPSRRQMRARE
ncbi:hypothetical protein Apa02nite_096450 [Actinoplanes palleronii]|uniref:Transposase n=1 Tax=Actinoplanes palleronii TaxID=113570 RepID=A0ABQ4BS96_9ACTN|nr:hypothetical protein Apa02nite_096450 [Actinoplanes palleronii]